MRFRFLIGIAVALLVAGGSVAAALIVQDDESDDFHALQAEEAERAASQAEALASLSVGELGSAAAFLQAEAGLNEHQFEVVAHSLLRRHGLDAAAFVERVPLAARASYERTRGVAIVENGPGDGLRPARRRTVYFPLTFLVSLRAGSTGRGYDLGSVPGGSRELNRARDSGKPAATPVRSLVPGGVGIIVYRPVYRDGAATATVAERRAALLGFVAGSFRIGDIARAAAAAVPGPVDVQLRVGRNGVIGEGGQLEDAARSKVKIADRTWLLIVRDPNRPGVSLPLALGVVGISLAALLAALIFVWSRRDQIEELQREASEDPLTGLKNRRRFEEDLRLAMARARRERTTGALVMLDLDHFKLVNDTYGHPAGDQLLVQVAAALRRRSRESDVLARLGGDEFAVILPRCTVQEARLAAEAIGAAIREHERRLDGAEPITASIGIAMFGDRPRTTIDSIVSEADSAMYLAKDEGRDAIRIFDRHAILDDAPGG